MNIVVPLRPGSFHVGQYCACIGRCDSLCGMGNNAAHARLKGNNKVSLSLTISKEERTRSIKVNSFRAGVPLNHHLEVDFEDVTSLNPGNPDPAPRLQAAVGLRRRTPDFGHHFFRCPEFQLSEHSVGIGCPTCTEMKAGPGPPRVQKACARCVLCIHLVVPCMNPFHCRSSCTSPGASDF